MSAALLGGVYHALVTNNRDPQHFARVKVKFPWLPDGEETYWAQLATPMAGDHFGIEHIPEIGDMVAVVFIGGSIDAPVVVGGLWSSVDPPPEDNAGGKNDIRLIKSRSGHRVIFDDGDNTKLAITDKGQACVAGVGTFAKAGDGANAVELPVPKASAGEPKNGVAMAATSGDLKILCPAGKLSIDAQTVEVTARGKVHLHAGSDLSLEGAVSKVVAAGKAAFKGAKVKVGP